MTEWNQVRLKDTGRVVTGTTPPSGHPEWFGDLVPFITPSDIYDTSRRAASQRFLSQAGRAALGGRLIPKDSICFVCIGATIGKLCLVSEESITNQQINSICPNDSFDSRFLYYLLKHEASRIARLAAGAATPILNKTNFSEVVVRIPEERTQVAVGSVLGSFDDLIENNQRRVELLEEMARAIYREWFVHFRFPGHEDVTFVDSDLGLIPEGWECSPLANHTSLISRGIAPKYADDGEWVVLNQRCIRNRRVSLLPARRHGGDVARKKHLKHGDILINSTGVGTLGRVAQWRGHGNATTDSHVTIVRSIRTDDHLWLAHWAIENARHFESLGTGATGQTELSRTDIQNIQLPVPPADIRVMFGNTVQWTIELTDLLMARSEVLVGMRDLLLPKLVTGQIDLSNLDLNTVVEQAGV